MNQKNLEYLKDGLKYLGFGEGLYDKLTSEIKTLKSEFQLHTQHEYGKDKISYTLDFKKSDQSDMYFFNKYTATIAGNDNSDKTQTFHINKNAGITAKEAYNLLNGRSVNKDLLNSEGQKFNAWLQLSFDIKDDRGNHKFRQFTTGYGYNLENELGKHAIKELNEPLSKERLMQSLERGNLHQVTFVKGDREDRMFIEANPQFKTLNIYDSSMKKIFIENNRKEAKVESEVSSTKQEEKSGEKKKEEQDKELKQGLDDESSSKGKKAFRKPKLSV
jgi:hypothetical protein